MNITKQIIFAISLVALIVVNHAYADTPTITDVTVQQRRYPWNGEWKMDISYTVTGDIAAEAKQRGLIPSLKVTATDMSVNKTYTAGKLTGDMSLTAGTHSLVWDLGEEGLFINSSNVVLNVSCEKTPATYCVIDLSSGASASSYPVTYLKSVPNGGFNADVYKTTKIVLRRIEAGTFIMGASQNNTSHRVTLTKPFFSGIFEMTQKQYSLVMGKNPSNEKGDMRPVARARYGDIRGYSSGTNWPASSDVDSDSFMGRLRARTGLQFDLPTEAQWEYACRAGTTSQYNNGGDMEDDLRLLGRYSGNKDDGKGGYSGSHTKVGAYAPNAWGLYDMHGNVWEFCLDWVGDLSYGIDPKGPSTQNEYGATRRIRGGSYHFLASACTSDNRGAASSVNENYDMVGFRLARTMPSAEMAGSICSGTSLPTRIDMTSDSIFWFRENAETGWFVDPGNGEDTIFRSGEIGNSTNSWMETTIVGPLSFSFDWKVSCNTRGHYLAWLIDGVEQARIRGETDWATVNASVPEGEHVVRFDYVKGSTAAAGEDKGQVRNFKMGLRVDTDSMQVTWDWTTNYWVECSIVGKGATAFEPQWVADGTNLVIPFSVNTPFYSLSLSGDSEGAVLGEDSITVPISSPRSIVLTVTEYAYNTALDSGLLPWMSDGTASWVPQGEVSHDGQDAVRSGEVTGDDVSTLSTVVSGPGTLSWWWKLVMADCAGVDVFVDGALVESLDSASDWAEASVDIVGDGEHTVRFEFWNAGSVATMSDCAYLDQVSWTGMTVDHTVTTPVPVPYSYFDVSCPTLLSEHGGYYEAAGHAAASNGRNKVWECFVAGISPTNETSVFTAKIEMKDGMPVVTWEPNLNTNGVIRTYKVYGKETLENGGGEWQYPTNSTHRFFKVTVEMP